MILALNFILTTISLALVHERLPDREKYGPLPDIVLDNFSEVNWALDVSEVLIMIQTNSCIVLMAFHKHRWGEKGEKRRKGKKKISNKIIFQIHSYPPSVPISLAAVPDAVGDHFRYRAASAKHHLLL